jgi:acetoacetyl-[acyl-carrier protein] synthase
MVIDKLGAAEADKTWYALRQLMQMGHEQTMDDAQKQYMRDHTLIRRIEDNLFNVDAIPVHKTAQLGSASADPISFTIKRNQLPDVIPSTWEVKEVESTRVLVTVKNDLNILFPDLRESRVKSAGLLPTGFNPEKLYQSRNHPRGLQLTVYGASDAINSLGFDWEIVRQRVPGDQIAVYASAAMGQLDANGAGGMLQAALQGRRVSSKNCPLSLAEMSADFVNAYILGSVGSTGANIGACATFLYNLRQGMEDIRSGKYRAVVVGASEAPVTPEVIEGYRTMGALAEDDALNKIDGVTGPADNRRACRPFGENCGFTLAEASQFVVLFDDELAMELGANIHGSVADVFINADGYKKSIPGPGIGNYITVGKAMGVIRSILGEDSVRHRSYMQAHGTGTPQNRVTESHIFNELAKTFGIASWPIAAIKAYVGHSLGTASGDQIVSSLGVWKHGLIPGIKTIDQIADDVYDSNLEFLLDHKEVDPSSLDAVFVNSKGFGGNNATAALISPDATEQMLARKHGKGGMTKYRKLNESVAGASATYDDETTAGKNALIYRFGEGVIEGDQLTLSDVSIQIPGHKQIINLNVPNPYDDMS